MSAPLKAPVKIDDLTAEWSDDCQVDITEPSRELAKIPNLHAKYLAILVHHNLVVKKLQNDYTALRKIKFDYYNGDLNNPDDLREHNLEPFTRKVLRQDIGMWLDADKDLNTLLLKKVIHQEIVEICQSILKELGNRHFSLGNIIKWEIFTGGN